MCWLGYINNVEKEKGDEMWKKGDGIDRTYWGIIIFGLTLSIVMLIWVLNI